MERHRYTTTTDYTYTSPWDAWSVTLFVLFLIVPVVVIGCLLAGCAQQQEQEEAYRKPLLPQGTARVTIDGKTYQQVV